MKKIAIVDSTLGAGGAEKLIVEMAPILMGKGYDVHVVILTSYGDVYSERLKEKGVKVSFLSSDNDFLNPRNIFGLIKILKDFDVVYSHVSHAQYAVSMASFFINKNVKLITTEHSNHNNRRGKITYKIIERIIYSNYDKIIAITNDVGDNLLRHLGRRFSRKILVINNGIDLNGIRFSEPKSKLDIGFKIDDIVLTMVGRFAEAKDQLTVIKAMEILPERYKLALIGDGEKKELCVEYVKEAGLNDRVKFLGFRTDAVSLIKACDVGILSSHWEGQPLSALEIMACGKPFIGSDVPGIRDLVPNAMLFIHGNPSDLAKKVSDLIVNSEVAKDNLKISNSIVRNFSIEETTNKYLDVAL
ncbi:TPA: glycosyltransferase [Vibrio parahaemolyticus]